MFVCQDQCLMPIVCCLSLFFTQVLSLILWWNCFPWIYLTDYCSFVVFRFQSLSHICSVTAHTHRRILSWNSEDVIIHWRMDTEHSVQMNILTYKRSFIPSRNNFPMYALAQRGSRMARTHANVNDIWIRQAFISRRLLIERKCVTFVVVDVTHDDENVKPPQKDVPHDAAANDRETDDHRVDSYRRLTGRKCYKAFSQLNAESKIERSERSRALIIWLRLYGKCLLMLMRVIGDRVVK